MIAVDTNILVYAHRRDSPWHAVAAATVKALAEGSAPWAIAWPSIHEFIAVVTHPKIYRPASTRQQSLAQVDAWISAPGLHLLSETAGHWGHLKQVAEHGRVVGAQIHDARIAALCIHHGVVELLTADRDFTRFPALKTRNPLVG